MMPAVTKNACELSGQRPVEQFDNFGLKGAIGRRHGTVFNVAPRRVKAGLVERQPALLALVARAGSVGFLHDFLPWLDWDGFGLVGIDASTLSRYLTFGGMHISATRDVLSDSADTETCGSTCGSAYQMRNGGSRPVCPSR